MNIKTITLKKEYKIGLPNYSNMTCSMETTFEPSESKNIEEVWKWIEGELQKQIENSHYINKQTV